MKKIKFISLALITTIFLTSFSQASNREAEGEATYFQSFRSTATSVFYHGSLFVKSLFTDIQVQVATNIEDGSPVYKTVPGMLPLTQIFDDVSNVASYLWKTPKKEVATQALSAIAKNPLDTVLVGSTLCLSVVDLKEVTALLKLASNSSVSILRFKNWLPKIKGVYGSNMYAPNKALVMLVIGLYCVTPAAAESPFFGESYQNFKNHFSFAGTCEGPASNDISSIQSCTGWNWFFSRKSTYDCRNALTETAGKTDIFIGEYQRTSDGIVRTSYTPGSNNICFFTSLEGGTVVKSCYTPGETTHLTEVVKGYSISDLTKGLKTGELKRVVAINSGQGIRGCGYYDTLKTTPLTTTAPVCINYRLKGQDEAELCFNPNSPSELTLVRNENPVIPEEKVTDLAEGQVASALTIREPPCQITFWSALKAWYDQKPLECEDVVKEEL